MELMKTIPNTEGTNEEKTKYWWNKWRQDQVLKELMKKRPSTDGTNEEKTKYWWN